MSVMVRGVYHDGTIVLLDRPAELRNGPVKVTLSQEPPGAPTILQYGKYSHMPGHESTEEDFRIAEWRGEAADEAG